MDIVASGLRVLRIYHNLFIFNALIDESAAGDPQGLLRDKAFSMLLLVLGAQNLDASNI